MLIHFQFDIAKVASMFLPTFNSCTFFHKMKEYTDSLRTNLETKGKELNQFRETHGIQIKADDSKDEKPAPKSGDRQANILASV